MGRSSKKNRGGDTATREKRRMWSRVRTMNKTRLKKGIDPIEPWHYSERLVSGERYSPTRPKWR